MLPSRCPSPTTWVEPASLAAAAPPQKNRANRQGIARRSIGAAGSMTPGRGLVTRKEQLGGPRCPGPAAGFSRETTRWLLVLWYAVSRVRLPSWLLISWLVLALIGTRASVARGQGTPPRFAEIATLGSGLRVATHVESGTGAATVCSSF